MATMATTLLGLGLLIALSVDLTLTLFSPFGHHGGPVHRLQNRMLWFWFRLIGRAAGARARPQVLALAGPVGVLVTVLLWSGWLIGAFALLYLPHLESFRTVTSTSSPEWFDALYYSGYVASTLGLGDVVATTSPMRALTIVEAVAGFTLFAVSTTYALTVTREAGLAAALPAEIEAFRKVADDAARNAAPDEEVAPDLSALAGRKAEGWAVSLRNIADAHRQYPLLHYFRPTREERSLVGQLGWVIGVLEGESARDPFPALSARLLAEAVDGYLSGLNEGCIPASFSPLPVDRASRADRHARVLAHLGYEAPAADTAAGPVA